jgi:CheY-like chemotaxis protein
MPEPLPILFIVDDEAAFVFDSFREGNFFIENMKEWESLDKSNLQYSSISILAELNWVTQAGFYGFNIGFELRRRYKCLLPIIMVSSMPIRHFEHLASTDIRYNLIYARGTGFIPLIKVANSLTDIIQATEPISLPLITDMNEMLFNLQGVLQDTLGHRLRADMNQQIFAETMAEMKALLNEEQIRLTKWDTFDKKLLQSLKNDALFHSLKSEFLLTIRQKIASNNTNSDIVKIEKRHKILIVEDNEIFAKEIFQNLNHHFVEIIITGQAQEAIDILESDATNSIVGLICDWRLYKSTGSKYWQKQGYEVLAYAAKQRYIALFGITSLSDTNVHSIRNMLGFEIHLFKKEHFVGNDASNQWQMMADLVLQKCDSITQYIASEPSGNAWQKIKSEYIDKRNTVWGYFENEVSQESKKLFKFYKKAIEEEDTRNVFSISEMGLSLKANLKNILIIRRVFFGIYAYLNQHNEFLQEIRPVSLLGTGDKVDTGQRHHGIDAYSILRKDWWDDISSTLGSVAIEEEWNKFEQRIKNFRNVLSIEISELPHRGLLPEEKAWFQANHIDFTFLYKYWTD